MLDFLHLPLTGTPFGAALEVCVIVTFVAWLVSVITRAHDRGDLRRKYPGYRDYQTTTPALIPRPRPRSAD